MTSNNHRKKTPVIKNKKHICPKCGFDNYTSAIYCEICFYPLDASGSLVKQPPLVEPPEVEEQSPSVTSFKQELQQPGTIAGLVVLGFAIALWVNHFLSSQPQYLTSSEQDNSIALYDGMEQVKDVPSGLYSYGGALYFASLVANGINEAMVKGHSDFHLRYTKPTNHDLSYSNGIKMLLDGELSFAFNGRPLHDLEYSQAKLRDMTLQQIPIALDGVVFFGNRSTTVDGLNLKQVQDIFTGKITNWSQLGGEDLPITPILLSPENIEILGLKDLDRIPKATKYVDNHTLALRESIATKGSISFASASLVKEQQLIKVFDLAAENSTNYISPLISTGQPNLPLFENGTYPLTRRLFLVIRQDGTPDRLAGKSYAEMLLSIEGQQIVEKSGFVPLRGDP